MSNEFGIEQTAEHRAILEGPFAVLSAPQGWNKIDMTQVGQLMAFQNGNALVDSVLDICYHSLLTDTIHVEEATSSKKRKRTDDDAHDPIVLARSRVFGKWGREASRIEAAIGWFIASFVPATKAQQIETGLMYLPTLLQLEHIQVWHRVDLHSQHEWRVFEKLPSISGTGGSGWCEVAHDRFLVLGNQFPTRHGALRSKLLTLCTHEWRMYMNKHDLTLEADRKRVAPPITTQAREQTYDPQRMAEAAVAAGEIDVDQTPAAILVQQRVLAKNCGLPLPLDATKMDHAQAADLRRARAVFVDLPDGREYVAAHMPEAPLEMPVARQAFLESLALLFGIPVSMLSPGDATGKAKLNTETAAPETAQIFQDAQAHRKRQLEYWIVEVCQFMFRRREMEERVLEAMLDEDEEEKECESLPSSLAPDKLMADTRWEASVSTSARMENILLLSSLGWLEEKAARRLLAKASGIPIDAFKAAPKLEKDQQLIQGIKQDTPKPAAKKAKKK